MIDLLLRRVVRAALTPRAIIDFTLMLTVAFILSVIIHEVGHVAAALFVRAKIIQVTVLGIQLFPEFAFLDGGFAIGRVDREVAGYDWQDGLIQLMGAGAATILAYSLIACIAVLKSSLHRMRAFLLILSLMCSWDIITYTFLPLAGLPHRLILGAVYAEPLEGAMLIGVSKTVMIMIVGLHGILFHILFSFALVKARQKKSEGDLLSHQTGASVGEIAGKIHDLHL